MTSPLPALTRINYGDDVPPGYEFVHDGRTYEATRIIRDGGTWGVWGPPGDNGRRPLLTSGHTTRTAAIHAITSNPNP